MTLRLAFLALVAVTALSLTAPNVIPRLSVLSGLWWWPATVISLAVAAALGLNWIRKASDKSPMQFVALAGSSQHPMAHDLGVADRVLGVQRGGAAGICVRGVRRVCPLHCGDCGSNGGV